ncbi:probable dolichyl pyrophosphate Man9GlcNAc2 alpha-1,3-glucosyltransferase isoform X2 [Drosophila busckii]|uniref:probable dolichyl pyrophosphate Man9GlcNAc2 alpha-1,3-glucosyltransferase isoform X2 n=1 Tax=Drosophila busckii TaxID=30019 RepID=UPI0014331DBD|nr:probable dolichyl pyrophosphate Man9GlcNAc2 alpha-1,3-glucosyltransferase isoform X2 [Drosophila busckii]
MYAEYIATACIALTLRSVISMNSFSGQNTPPMFGDYEAQRHWQEVTVNVDIKEWYSNSTNNDLLYWGLDYPPLTAYHSYVLGQVAQMIDQRYVALKTSRGIATQQHKSFMRLTVIAADASVYIPAMFVLCLGIDFAFKGNRKLAQFIIIALYPGQILIDNGHFQYNNVSLGLAAAAIAAVLYNKNYVAAFAFTLALNYKQMELYHALPFFSYLLSASISQERLSLIGRYDRDGSDFTTL